MSALISIIVPIYRSEKYIERCVRSLFEQTYHNIEYYFINDCSPDNSIQILNSVVEDYPLRKESVFIINFEHNQGNAAARNAGIRKCKGEYILQVDSDDWIEKNMLSMLYNFALSKNTDIACCEYIKEFTNRSEYVNIPFENDGREILRQCYWDLTYSAQWNKLIKKDLIIKYNCYCIENTNNWVDLGQITFLRFYLKKIPILHEKLYHYNCDNINSVSRNISNKRLSDILNVADYISRFLIENGGNDFRLVANHIRFIAKMPLITDASHRNYEKWMILFSESNHFIWQYPMLSFIHKFFYYMATKRMFFIFKFGKRTQAFIRIFINYKKRICF
jgi:glycosyltransferase involved in cell wall biosynthesis